MCSKFTDLEFTQHFSTSGLIDVHDGLDTTNQGVLTGTCPPVDDVAPLIMSDLFGDGHEDGVIKPLTLRHHFLV